MIFAKLDVELRDHEKAQRAGTAMGTWTWALLWTRAKERDGFVAAEALRGAWAGEKQAAKDMAALVSCGLASVAEGGWMLFGYAEKNETRDQIDQRRAEGRERKQRHVAKVRGRGNASDAATGNALPTRSGTRDERVNHTTEPEPEPESDLPPVSPPGGQPRELVLELVPSPKSASIDAFESTFDGTVEAYCAGIAAKTGGACQLVHHSERKALARAVAANFTGPLEGRAAWTRTESEAFARAKDPAFGGYSPQQFEKWLRDGRPAAKERPSGVRGSRPVQRDQGPPAAITAPARPFFEGVGNG